MGKLKSSAKSKSKGSKAALPIFEVDSQDRKVAVTGNQWRIFCKDPFTDSHRLRSNYLHHKRGDHFYFRNMKLRMQERFVDMIDHKEIPKVFIHGSPHLDNYSRNERCTAMVDFDRSRNGPYAWDLVRMLTSILYRQRNPQPLTSGLADEFFHGYRVGFKKPGKAFKEMDLLASIELEKPAFPVRDYLAQNKKWALALRRFVIPKEDEEMNQVLRGYLRSIEQIDLLDTHQIALAGRAKGSMGRVRFLVLLTSNDPSKDWILLEIKHVREDEDNEWYSNPFEHHGERMRHASQLYAPGWDLCEGYTTVAGVQYWGHRLPTVNLKLKKPLGINDQLDFLQSVGQQLGRAHALSQIDGSPKELLKHLEAHELTLIESAHTMKRELDHAYNEYLEKLEFFDFDEDMEEI